MSQLRKLSRLVSHSPTFSDRCRRWSIYESFRRKPERRSRRILRISSRIVGFARMPEHNFGGVALFLPFAYDTALYFCKGKSDYESKKHMA
jgi:hypothetical protein